MLVMAQTTHFGKVVLVKSVNARCKGTSTAIGVKLCFLVTTGLVKFAKQEVCILKQITSNLGARFLIYDMR